MIEDLSGLWAVRWIGGGAASHITQFDCDQYGPLSSFALGGDFYKLVWRQDKMRECEYLRIRNTKTDTVPEPT